MEQKPKQLLVIARILEPLLQMVEGSFGETDRWQHCSRLAYQLADTLCLHDERLVQSVRDLGAVCALAPEPAQQDVDKAFEEDVHKMLRAVNNWLEYERMESLKLLAVAAAAVSKAYASGRALAGHNRNHLDFKGNAHELRVFAQAISGRSTFVSDKDMLRCIFTADAAASAQALALNEFWLGELIAACCNKTSLERRIFPLDSHAIAGAMIELQSRYSSGICNPNETGTASYARAIIDGLLLVGGKPRQETVIENPIFAARFARYKV
jgi:hypothetical protein